jgi:hypothetical protein
VVVACVLWPPNGRVSDRFFYDKNEPQHHQEGGTAGDTHHVPGTRTGSSTCTWWYVQYVYVYYHSMYYVRPYFIATTCTVQYDVRLYGRTTNGVEEELTRP